MGETCPNQKGGFWNREETDKFYREERGVISHEKAIIKKIVWEETSQSWAQVKIKTIKSILQSSCVYKVRDQPFEWIFSSYKINR